MSFLESGKEGVRWIAAPLKHSVSRAPGCQQCGRMLEMNMAGSYPISGKCSTCMNPVCDGDDEFDDAEY